MLIEVQNFILRSHHLLYLMIHQRQNQKTIHMKFLLTIFHFIPGFLIIAVNFNRFHYSNFNNLIIQNQKIFTYFTNFHIRFVNSTFDLNNKNSRFSFVAYLVLYLIVFPFIIALILLNLILYFIILIIFKSIINQNFLFSFQKSYFSYQFFYFQRPFYF